MRDVVRDDDPEPDQDRELEDIVTRMTFPNHPDACLGGLVTGGRLIQLPREYANATCDLPKCLEQVGVTASATQAAMTSETAEFANGWLTKMIKARSL